MMASALSHSAIEWKLGTAIPPAAVIASTVRCAGVLSAPPPHASLPRSFTRTLAPEATAIDHLMDKDWSEEDRARFVEVAARQPGIKEIARASCTARVCQCVLISVVAVTLKNTSAHTNPKKGK